MIYVIFPRSKKPEQLSGNLFIAPCPILNRFRPLLNCNVVIESQGNEDEEGCIYHSDDCGDGAQYGRTKCYRFVRRDGNTTWSDANYECIQKNQNLVTLATPDELGRFRQLISFVRNPRPLYVGGQLEDRLKSVTVAMLYEHLWQWVDGRTALLSSTIG